MNNYRGNGDAIVIIAPAPVVSGQPLLIGAIFGICLASAAEGQPVELRLKGMYQLPKNAEEAWTFGLALYWDNHNAVVTLAAPGNTRFGVAVAPAANPSSFGNVRLNAVTAAAVTPPGDGPVLDLTQPPNVELFPAI